MKYFIFVLVFLSNAHAMGLQSAPEMIARQVEKKLSMVQNDRNSPPKSSFIYRNEDETAYYLKRIRFQYAPFVAFDLAFFEMKIIPFLEFRWTRKNPLGWVNYRRQ